MNEKKDLVEPMMSFEDALIRINKEISAISYPACTGGLYEPIRYILSLKGKKIRPVLTLLACDLYSDNIEPAIRPALAWEIYHNFTLVHDDVMDKADMRRSKPTVHKVWDENTAILSGDAMLVMAYQYIAEAPAGQLKRILDLFSATANEIFEGQRYDMEFETRMDVSEEEYMEMIRLKTAVLLGASLKTGALIGGAEDVDADFLYKFGVNLGLAFQIKDDLLDVYGDPSVFGKNIGGDILCNKKTYLLIQALNLSEGKERWLLEEWMTTEKFDPAEKIASVKQIYDRLNIKQVAESKMECCYQQAVRSLELVNVNPDRKEVLLDLAGQLMVRNV